MMGANDAPTGRGFWEKVSSSLPEVLLLELLAVAAVVLVLLLVMLLFQLLAKDVDEVFMV
jgi:hypothetical protein